ncbi:MAG: dihydrolipoyl dehydrogenase [Puniceicoccaceae bacterium]
MATNNRYDLAVVGGGPAGYPAAIRAAQLGKKVICIEKERAGGTCLNWGCIPSKALLKSAETYATLKHADVFGISAKEVSFDFEKVVERSRGVADRMAKGIEFLFKKNKIDYKVGSGKVLAPGMVECTDADGNTDLIEADKIMIATGCTPRLIPGVEVDGERIMTSREILANKTFPKSMIVVGAGAIGVEFAYFFNTLGCEVTLVEMLPQILPVEDAEVAQAVTRSFKKQGMTVHVNTKVENIKTLKTGVNVELVFEGGKREKVKADVLLQAIGVVPNLEKALSPRVKPELERGYLKVDERYETSIKGVFAAGDIIGPPWLAHVATFEAVQAVNGMFSDATPKKVGVFPGCTYCNPQVASVGLTEAKVKEKGIDYKVGKFPYTASGKAVATDHTEGFVKLITDAKYGEILGAHIVGYDATEMIAEYGLAMNSELTVDDIHNTIHAHPTLAEMMMEAASDVHKEAIHI